MGSGHTIYYRRDKLIAIPEIRRLIPAERPSMGDLADAVAAVFPHLATPQR
jgi:hypothetical protein